ncbi:MAG: hypothetical protein H6702_24260 [Myxococcales bacterium]|nr:hypothetical protein [Myxococcales bacterium]
MIHRAGLALAMGLLIAAPGCDDGPAPTTSPLALRTCRLNVRFTHRGVPGLIGVSGDFNGFDAAVDPLVRVEGDTWAATVALTPGEHRYRIEVDGRPFPDPANPLEVRHRGETYSRIVVPDCTRPAFTLSERRHEGGPVYALTLQRVDAAVGLDAASVAATVDGDPVAVEVQGDTVRFDARSLPRGKHGFRLTARDTAGREAEPLEAPFWVEPELFRWEDAVVYQVFTDRFAPAERDFGPADRVRPIGARLGGHLDGVRRKLRDGYFARLGINVLWISPMYLNPDGIWTGVEGGEPRYESYHGYWPIQPRRLDPRFGDAAVLEGLIAEAHAQGIRVLLDVVLNHVHAAHPYYAAHPAWFTPPGCYCGQADCSWAARIETCWFTPYLPDVAWQDAATLTTQVDDALWWIERFGFDGLRVDAVPMMPRFVTRALTERVHARFEGLGTRHYLVGETFTGPGEWSRIRWYLGPAGLDGQFDFPLMWALRQALAWEATPLWDLADAWATSEAAWAGSTAVMGNFVGNHDVSRFISEAAGQLDGGFEQAWEAPPPIPESPIAYARHLLALTFVFGVPGAATVYQGDEYGQPGANDPDNRRPMRFGSERTAPEQALFERFSRVARARACLPALRRGALYPLRAERERLAWLRDLGDGAPAVVALARDPDEPRLQLGLPPGHGMDGRAFVDVLSGQRVAVAGDALAPLALPAYTPAVLVPADHPCAAVAAGG